MNNTLQFESREKFRAWLNDNCLSDDGIWIVFGKTKDTQALKSSEALEEALCFGWIDGAMKKIDEKTYIKYFSKRRRGSNWSLKNKSLTADLEKRGLMTDFGRAKIEEAKQNGQWDKAKKPSDISEEQIETVCNLLKKNKLAYANFQKMSPSVQRTYTRAYFDAKTDKGRKSRLSWMTDRLENNLKPM